jgi:ABC-type uncharacterized transport system auxiliary subunit
MRLSLLCASALVIASCSMPKSRAAVEREQYVIRARGAEAMPTTTERATIRVAPVGIAAHIRGVAIVTDDGRVRTMVNQSFAAPIGTLVEEAVTDRLRASGRFGVVLPPGHPSSAPLTLRLSLRAFEITVTDVGYQARVVFDGLLEREPDRRVVRAFRASADRPAQGPGQGGFVHGLEDALNGAIDGLIQELEAAGVGGIAPPALPETVPADTGGDRTG